MAARGTIKKELTQTDNKKFIEILDNIRNTTIIREESVFYFEKVYAAHNNSIHWLISTGSFPVFETKQKKEQEEKEAQAPMQL